MPDDIICKSTYISEVSPEWKPPAAQIGQRFFSLFQAAQIFGKSARTMRWWADTGRIRTVKIGRARFVTETEIQRLITDDER